MSDKSGGGNDAATELNKKSLRSAGAEMIIPVCGSLFAVYYFSTIWNSPWTAQVSAFFIGAVLMLTSAVVVIRILAALRRGEARLTFDLLIEPRAYIPKRLGLLALIFIFILAIPHAGFTLTTFGFLTAAMALLNDRKRMGLIVALSAALALMGWLVFVHTFDIRFPAGPFEMLMRGIL